MSLFDDVPNLNPDPSRRRFIRDIGLTGGLLGMASIALIPQSGSAGAVKLDQRAAEYQPTPKGKARCDNCVQWQAPDACKVVKGKIDPSGWCVLYARKM